MKTEKGLLIGKGQADALLLPAMGNRHGLIAGATGTGKTITLKGMAESFSQIGVPVFLADIKGDLSGMIQAGEMNPKLQERLDAMGITDFPFQSFPTYFWDLFGEMGHPVRTTVSAMGPLLLGRLLELNDTQAGVLSSVFRIADDQGLLLLDMKDLKEMLKYVGENRAAFTADYGTLSPASLGVIQRNVMTLEDQGGDFFFGEPALDIEDWLRTDSQGLGHINILHAVKLYQSPRLYSTFLMWMLSELFQVLPEAGDLDKPKLVFFFDEAHLLFNDAPKALLDKLQQVVRLIRSKGVGVYFITQSPMDVPEDVLGQLGNRVQHALRAFTPKDQKMVRSTAQTFRTDGSFSVEEALTQLKTGEALISFLEEKGNPSPVERALVLPPMSKMGPAEEAIRKQVFASSIFSRRYDQTLDRDSAYEMLHRQYAKNEVEKAQEQNSSSRGGGRAYDPEIYKRPNSRSGAPSGQTTRQPSSPRTTASRPKKSGVEKMAESAANSFGRQLGRELVRGIFGSLMKPKR